MFFFLLILSLDPVHHLSFSCLHFNFFELFSVAAYVHDNAQDGQTRLSSKTICMVAVQGETDSEYRHYDVHNLYGWSQTPPTLQ